MGGREGEREREVSFACRRRLFLPLLATSSPPFSLVDTHDGREQRVHIS